MVTEKLRITARDCRSGKEISREIEGASLKIGRGIDKKDWTLPDETRRLSKIHCSIEYQEGSYFVMDRSRNGTFLNGERLPTNEPVKLKDGDVVSLCDSEPVYRLTINFIPQVQNTIVREKVIAARELWWNKNPAINTAPKNDPSAPGEEKSEIAEGMRNLEQLLRQTVDGLQKLLRARNDVKKAFRVSERTVIHAKNNNPIKLMPVDQAITQLLTGKDSKYLPGEKALGEVFSDLQAHELAMLAGTEAAIRHLLERFDPRNIESQPGKNTLLENLTPNTYKAKCWDNFARLHEETTKEAEDDLHKLFKGVFERAYEEQLERLTNAGKSSR